MSDNTKPRIVATSKISISGQIYKHIYNIIVRKSNKLTTATEAAGAVRILFIVNVYTLLVPSGE